MQYLPLVDVEQSPAELPEVAEDESLRDPPPSLAVDLAVEVSAAAVLHDDEVGAVGAADEGLHVLDDVDVRQLRQQLHLPLHVQGLPVLLRPLVDPLPLRLLLLRSPHLSSFVDFNVEYSRDIPVELISISRVLINILIYPINRASVNNYPGFLSIF